MLGEARPEHVDEPPGTLGQEAPARVERDHVERRRGELREYDPQPPRLDLRPDQPGGQHGDPLPRHRQVAQRLTVVGSYPRPNLHRLTPGRGLERPGRTAVATAGVDQACVVAEGRGIGLTSVPLSELFVEDDDDGDDYGDED